LSGYRVAMDIGGTFTDFVVFDEGKDGETSSGKVLTTPANPAEGVLAGLREFIPELTGIEFLVHGTTVGLNAFLERKGTR
jgi:N-methylhydantoinase A